MLLSPCLHVQDATNVSKTKLLAKFSGFSKNRGSPEKSKQTVFFGAEFENLDLIPMKKDLYLREFQHTLFICGLQNYMQHKTKSYKLNLKFG